MAVFYRYKKLQKCIKYPNGTIIPVVPNEFKRGELISQESFETLDDCQFDYQYRWNKIEVTEDSDSYICEGYSQYYKEVYQQSTDGEHWTDVVPRQERKGELIAENSEACGYISDAVAVEIWLNKPGRRFRVALYKSSNMNRRPYKTFTGRDTNILRFSINDLVTDSDGKLFMYINLDDTDKYEVITMTIRFPETAKNLIKYLQIDTNSHIDSYTDIPTAVKLINVTKTNFPDLEMLAIHLCGVNNPSEIFKNLNDGTCDVYISRTAFEDSYETDVFPIVDFNNYIFSANYPYFYTITPKSSIHILSGSVGSIVANSLKIGTCKYPFSSILSDVYFYDKNTTLTMHDLDFTNSNVEQIGLFDTLTNVKVIDLTNLKINNKEISVFIRDCQQLEEIILDNSFIRVEVNHSPSFSTGYLTNLKKISAKNCDEETIAVIKEFFGQYMSEIEFITE